MPRTSGTPSQRNDISSPIWDCSITAVEAFFYDKPEKGEVLHACIEQESWTGSKWTAGGKLIDNTSSASKGNGASRILARRDTSHNVQQAVVCSVRVYYNRTHMFLDRDEDDWHSWRRGDFVLSTREVKNMLAFLGPCIWLI